MPVAKNVVESILIVVGLGLLAAGCKPSTADRAPAEQAKAPAAASPAIQISFSDLSVPPEPEVTPQLLAHGKVVYDQNCLTCHGAKGDGQGEAAAFLLPKPRNFVLANYRMRSTPTGQLPTDADLFRSVSLGMVGTPMPPWRFHLSDDERWAVVEYIKTFSPRFANTNDNHPAIVSLGTPPASNAVAVAEGKTLFTKLACITCHGESGRGDGNSAASLMDDNNTHITPRDFTKPGMFKAGHATKEIARTILTGFNGTPMLGFNGTIPAEDAWKLAYYVDTFARPAAAAPISVASRGFLDQEKLGEPDVRINLIERAWKYYPNVIRVKKDQVVEVTFEPTENGLGAGHGFAISSYDEEVFLNGAMVGAPKTVKFRANRAGKFTFYCATQCSLGRLHPEMTGTFIVDDESAPKTASAE